MADTASPSAAAANGLDLSAAHVPPSFLTPTTSAKNPSNLALVLSPTASSSSSPHQPHQAPSTSSPATTPYSPNLAPRPRSSSVQLPTTHQVLTPHSKPLTLTSPPTPTAAPPSPHLATAPSPSSAVAIAELRDVAPEDRFLPLSIDAQSPQLAVDLFKLLSTLYLPFFLQPPAALPSLSASSLAIDSITGGITNTLYRVTLPATAARCEVPAVLVRIFGPSTDQVIDRLTETRLVCDLSRSRAGVRIYGHFTNGRLEEWLYATPLTPHTMPAHATHIAATLATLHAQRIGWLADRPSPLYTTLAGWLDTARGLVWDGAGEQVKRALVEETGVEWWASELDETLALLRASRWSDDPLVFCHNDLLSGNILLQQKAATAANGVTSTAGAAADGATADGVDDGAHVFLVDYEYSGNNYAAFDIANHCCECCGFECDWTQLPKTAQRLTFIRAYLIRWHAIHGQTGTDVEAEAELLDCKVRGFLVLSHLWWGIWAVVQAKFSTIDFDYLHYSLLRKQGYLLMKDESHRLLKESCKR